MLLPSSGGKGHKTANRLIPATVASLTPLTILIDGASTPVNCIQGNFQLQIGLRVSVQQIGAQLQVVGLPPTGTSIPVAAQGKWNYIGQPGIPFKNSWTNYDGGYQFGPARFMQDTKGKVRFCGLITAGTGIIMTLPAQYWPAYTQIFTGLAGGSQPASSVDLRVDTSGNVFVNGYTNGGNNGFVSLAQISFFPASANIPWVTITSYMNSWVPYPLATLGLGAQYYVDVDGICHWQGLLASGTSGPSIIFNLATGVGPPLDEIFWIGAAGGLARIDFFNANLQCSGFGTGASNTFVTLAGIEYPTANYKGFFGSAAGTGYVNSWVSYDTTIFLAGTWICDSAGIVSWHGLIKNGTAAAFFQPMAPFVRPDFQELYISIANSNNVRLDVTAVGGTILPTYGTSATNAFLSLCGLKYPRAGIV